MGKKLLKRASSFLSFILYNAVLDKDIQPWESRNNTCKNNRVFFSRVWYLQSAAFRLMKMKVFCQNFFGLRRIKHWKIRIAYRQWHSNFLEGEEKEKPEIMYSVALVMAFPAAESENRQLKYLPQADFGRAPERFFLWVRTNAITDNFVYWKLGSLFVFVEIQCMYSSWVRRRTIWSLCGDCRSFYFHL